MGHLKGRFLKEKGLFLGMMDEEDMNDVQTNVFI